MLLFLFPQNIMNEFNENTVINRDKIYETLIKDNLKDITKMVTAGMSISAVARHFHISEFKLSEEMYFHPELVQAILDGFDNLEVLANSSLVELAKGAVVKEGVQKENGDTEWVKVKKLAPDTAAVDKLLNRVAHGRASMAVKLAENEERKKINPLYMKAIEARKKDK